MKEWSKKKLIVDCDQNLSACYQLQDGDFKATSKAFSKLSRVYTGRI
jgi:hypothetical protein